MVRKLLKKVFRKGAQKKAEVQKAIKSASLFSHDYHFAENPMTATERTVHKINEYNNSLKSI